MSDKLPIYTIKTVKEEINPQTILNQELKDKIYDNLGCKLKSKDYQEFLTELLYDCESSDEQEEKTESIIEFCKNLIKAAEEYERTFDPSLDYVINPDNI